MRKLLGIVGIAVLIACGSMGSNGGNGGGGGTGGGGAGGSGGGGGGNGGTGGGGSGGGGGGGGTGGSGGGGGVGVAPDYVSGTRIKVRVQTTADGAKEAFGFYDSQLAIRCALSRAADDTVRCLPQEAIVYPYWGDSNCSVHVATPVYGCVPASETLQYAYTTTVASTCNAGPGYPVGNLSHVYSVTGLHSGPVYSGAGGPTGCATVTTTQIWYDVGAEVPASTFAPGSTVIE